METLSHIRFSETFIYLRSQQVKISNQHMVWLRCHCMRDQAQVRVAAVADDVKNTDILIFEEIPQPWHVELGYSLFHQDEFFV